VPLTSLAALHVLAALARQPGPLLATVSGPAYDGRFPATIGDPVDGPLPVAGSGPAMAFGAVGDPDMERVAALVVLAQRGDRQAFGVLYDLYVERVYRYLYLRTGSHQLAEDLTSETFLRALRRLGTFTWQGRDIGAWFITIARNLVIDHFRSGSFRLEVSTAELLDLDPAVEGIEDGVLGRLEAATVSRALRQLKPEQQECLVLRFLNDLSLAETARVMGRSENAVKQLQLRALRSLARLLPESSK
jgi:RNA polymerase sigma-70 factor, ECF subfamily